MTARIEEARKKSLKGINNVTAHLNDAELYELLLQLQACIAASIVKLGKKGV